jgi:hypothetical protein
MGATWAPVDSALSAEVWDLDSQSVVGTLRVTASGKVTAVGVAPGIAMLSVISFPATETTACNALGRHLAEYLIGGTPPVLSTE